MPFFCYLLECSDGSYYCGWTMDLEKRVQAHSSGKGARYTRSRLPIKLVFSEEFDDRSSAMRRECEIKGKNHREKKALVVSSKDEIRI